MPSKERTIFVINGVRTLPLCVMIGRAIEEIPAFGSGKVEPAYQEPRLEPSPFRCDAAALALASRDWGFAMSATKAWHQYAHNLINYLQFRDDSTRVLTRSLHDHGELLSRMCDLRLGLDPTPFSRVFHSIRSFGIVQADYRQDEQKTAKYNQYADQLDRVYSDLYDHRANADSLIARMERIMEAKRPDWPTMHPLHGSASLPVPVGIEKSLDAAQLDELMLKLNGLQCGKEQAGVFEDVVGGVIRYCFSAWLTNVEPRRREVSKTVIRDWIASNRATSGFWEMIRQRYYATQIIFECKNYEELAADDFHQAAYYMTQEIGRFTVIAFRGEIKKHYFNHVKRISSDKNGVVLLLTEKDLLDFLRQSKTGKVDEVLLQDRYDSTIREIS